MTIESPLGTRHGARPAPPPAPERRAAPGGGRVRLRRLASVSRELDHLFEHEADPGAGCLPAPGEGARLLAERVAAGFPELRLPLATYRELAQTDRAHLDRVFEGRLFPVLTPVVIDRVQPLRSLANPSLHVGVMLRDPRGGPIRLAGVEIVPALPRLLALPGGHGLVPVEEVVGARLDRLFPGMRVYGSWPFRVTRLACQPGPGCRRRPSRLQVDAAMASELVDALLAKLELTPERLFRHAGPLDVARLELP